MLPGTVLPQLVGARVRQQRQARGWTLGRLAEVPEVSRRMLVDIEQAAANPSTGTLLEISDALGVALADLVAQPRHEALQVTPSGTAPALSTSPTGGRAVLVASTGPPQLVELWDRTLGPADRYAHDGHTAGTRALLHVQQGEDVEVAGRTAVLQTGDAVSFTGDVPHAYGNPSTEPARFSLSVLEADVGTPPRSRSPRA